MICRFKGAPTLTGYENKPLWASVAYGGGIANAVTGNR